MKKFINLLRKDIRELVTVQLILPLVIMIVLLNFVGKVVSSETKKASAPQDVVVMDLDRDDYSRVVLTTLEQGQFKIVQPDVPSIEEAINFAEEKNYKVVIVIPKGFSHDLINLKQPEVRVYSIYKGFSISQLSQPTIVKSVFNFISDTISKEFILKKFTGIDPAIVQKPIALTDYSVVNGRVADVSPEIITQAFSSRFFFIPIILVIVIVFSAQMLASLVAMEKQDKTLETLLTVPVHRHLIVLSKMLSAGIVALIISAVYMFGFTGYMQGITGGEISITNPQVSIALNQLGLTFTRSDLFLLGVSLFFAILAALAIATILAVYAQDVKDTQALLTPLMVLLMLPYFLTLFTDINSLPVSLKFLLYAIPFSHPFLAVQNLLFGRFSPVFIGIAYEIVFSVICIFIATRIFSSDKILTARVKIRRFNLKR